MATPPHVKAIRIPMSDGGASSREQSRGPPEESASRRKQHKVTEKTSKRKRAEEALAQSQKEAALYRRERDEVVNEKRNVEVKLRDIESALDERKHGDGPSPAKAQAVSNEQLKSEEAIALHLGKYVTLRYKMWTAERVLDWLPLQKYAQEKDSEEEDGEDEEGDIAEDVSEEVKADALFIVSCAPEDFRPALRKSSVKSQVVSGQRSMRSSSVNNIINAPQDIFGGSSEDYPSFKKKPFRATLPKVQALLQDDQFLYDGAATNLSEGYMRNPCILNILRSILFGSTAASLGERATRARRPYAKILGITDVNIPMLAFAATVAYFVLSGQSELTKDGNDDYAFKAFYDEHIRKLTRMGKSSPLSKRRLDELLSFYNQRLFPAKNNVEVRGERQLREDKFNDHLEKEREQYERDERERERQASGCSEGVHEGGCSDATGAGTHSGAR
ncbi:hypothetical protein HDZ31DRAFT_75306 [Schizophyllum fasciatum]